MNKERTVEFAWKIGTPENFLGIDYLCAKKFKSSCSSLCSGPSPPSLLSVRSSCNSREWFGVELETIIW